MTIPIQVMIFQNISTTFMLQGPPYGCQLSTADGRALQRQRPRTPHPGGDQGAGRWIRGGFQGEVMGDV